VLDPVLRETARPPTARHVVSTAIRCKVAFIGYSSRLQFQSRTRTQFMKGTELQSTGKRLPRTLSRAPDCPFVWMFHGGRATLSN